MQAFVPKNRRPRFDLTLSIIDLSNIPLVCGTSYVKWHLPSSMAAEHRGHTDRAVIQDHRASWDYQKVLPVKLTIDRNHMLQECDISFEVFQEFSSGSRGDRITLGNIKLNLAEYVDKSEDDSGVVRRYLMQDSKINSTLKVGILMRQVDGDHNYITPPLKSAMVFGGIAGILPPEHGEVEEPGSLPSINASREASDMQDMYRRILAASWTSQSDELLPDLLIEDLFAGGSGYRSSGRGSRMGRGDDYDDSNSFSDTASRTTVQEGRPIPDKRPKSSLSSRSRTDMRDAESGFLSNSAIGSVKESLEGPFQDDKDKTWKKTSRSANEVCEFDVREDLRTWEVTVND